MRRRLLAGIAAILLGLVAASAAFAWHLGYFGGPLYTLVAAHGRPRDGTVAVFFSGDMGFNAGMGPHIAAGLADAGIPVLAVNSLTAFAHRRSEAQADAMVTDAVHRAASLPGARRIVLIGQSFGANVVLAGAAALSPSDRRRLALVALIVPSETMLFRATPGGAFDFGHDGPALPRARRLADTPVLCLSGETETDSLCPAWRQPNVTDVTLPGDHFLHEDSALVAATVLRTLDTVTGA